VKAILVTRYGGPEVLELADVPDPDPVEGRETYEITAAAVNFAETHQTEDTYLWRHNLPFTPGMKFVGFDAGGTRVAGIARDGAYAQKISAGLSYTWPIPEAISDVDALALGLHGVSAWHCLRTFGRLAKGESVVVHAAAGGVGGLAVQLAKRWGAGRVIATASTDEKRGVALELGADVAVDSTSENLTAVLLDANGGRPVDVVLEMVGGRVFDESLDALGPFGRLVTYGNASRSAPKPVQPESLMDASRTVSGFSLTNLMQPQRQHAYQAAVTGLYSLVAKGELKPLIGNRYPLADARRAHEDLRARRTIGVQVLEVRS
jgi:NADPH2:quinone reductase